MVVKESLSVGVHGSGEPDRKWKSSGAGGTSHARDIGTQCATTLGRPVAGSYPTYHRRTILQRLLPRRSTWKEPLRDRQGAARDLA